MPVDVDFKLFTELNGLLVARGAWKAFFPANEDESRESPRLYDSAGAAVYYSLTGQTQRVPSEFLGAGGGAFDFPVQIQVLACPGSGYPSWS